MLPNYMPLCNVIKEISIPYPLQSEINLELLRRENRKSKKIMQTKKKKQQSGLPSPGHGGVLLFMVASVPSSSCECCYCYWCHTDEQELKWLHQQAPLLPVPPSTDLASDATHWYSRSSSSKNSTESWPSSVCRMALRSDQPLDTAAYISVTRQDRLPITNRRMTTIHAG